MKCLAEGLWESPFVRTDGVIFGGLLAFGKS